MKYRILNNNSLEFFDATANNTGLIAANGTNLKISANNGVIELGDTASDVQVGTIGTAINWTFLGGGTIGTGGINTLSMGQSGDTVNMNVAGVTYQYPSSFLRFNEISGANNKINITTQVPGSVILNLPNRPVVGQLSLTDNVPTSSNTAGTLTVAGGIGVSGNVVIGTTRINNDRTITNYGITTNALGAGSGSRTIDLTLGNFVTANATGITTWTFSNPVASPNACGFILKLGNGGSATQTWPTAVRWPSGTAPTLTAAGTDVLVFITDDGGINWRGVASMLDSK